MAPEEPDAKSAQRILAFIILSIVMGCGDIAPTSVESTPKSRYLLIK